MIRLTRRQALAGAAATLAAASLPRRSARAADPLKVAVYGGYFKDSFDEHIFPIFTKETGIEIEGVPEPTSEAWAVQLEQAARAGETPADVSMISQTIMLRGQSNELWLPLDPAKLPNMKNLEEHHVHKYPDGRIDGLNAVTWYITIVTNTEVIPDTPTSWADFWDPKHKDQLGLLSLPSNSFLLEITATTFFGDKQKLATDDGVLEVMNKLAELKPNVRLWYRDEGQFQQALETGEIPMGEYYHDVTGLAASEGKPVRSTFPKEGGVLDSGAWTIAPVSKKIEEAYKFIDFMCRPDVQDVVSRKLGTAPTVKREHLTLTDEEFAAVSSEIPPIIPEYSLYVGERQDFVTQKWNELVTG
jgi:putative spermidine/putrescine transport system substrate-binding protein